jgi:hypothetical protein
LNKVSFLVLFALSLSVFLGSNQEAQAISLTVSWDGGAGTSNWNDPLNWDTNVVPDSDDDITIDSDSIVFLNVNHSIISGSLTIGTGDTLQILSGRVLSNFGTITNSGTIKNFGTITNYCGAEYFGNPPDPTTNPVTFFVCDEPLTCGPKTMINAQNQCVPNLTLICGQGTTPNFDTIMCIATNMGNMIGGALLDIDTSALLVAAVGTNPVITGLVGITLAGLIVQAAWFIHKKKKF